MFEEMTLKELDAMHLALRRTSGGRNSVLIKEVEAAIEAKLGQADA